MPEIVCTFARATTRDEGARYHRQIRFDRLNIEEADVVVAVARREAPGTAARFDGKQNPHRFLPFDDIELRLDACAKRGLDEGVHLAYPASSTEVRYARA